jgi:rod shape-determining protein MreC
MDWRTSWLRERKAFLHTCIAVVLSCVMLLAAPLADVAGNVITAVVYYPFHKIRDTIERWNHTADENDALRANLAELSAKLQLYDATLEENRRLRALSGFSPPAGFRIKPAEIVGVFGSGIPNTVLINLGATDAIHVNDAVINRDGIAGRVARVMSDYSVVYLLTEPRCRVAARISRSREQGIVRFSMRRGMYLDNVPQRADVQVGDTVITSGLGGIFPEGLMVGIVVQIESPSQEFFYDVMIQPAANFNGLDELFVLVEGR